MTHLTNEQKSVYAILADNVYWDIRKDKDVGTPQNSDRSQSNWTPVPQGWKLIHEVTGSNGGIWQDAFGGRFRDWELAKKINLDGFTARAYQNESTNEVVIAYAGTEKANLLGDWRSDVLLATGVEGNQAVKAALFYHIVKHDIEKTIPNADIKFTGHSLGGGLAGLMGILFDREAYLFDHAPFENQNSNFS